MAEPLTDDERQRIRELHAAGRGCNQIARDLGRSPAIVSKTARELGLSFDRSTTVAATEAKKADASALRAALMLDYLEDARRLRGQLWESCEYREYGGRDFTLRKWRQREPTPADKLKLMQASTMAADRSLRLQLFDGESEGLAAVDAWLRDVEGGEA